MTTKLDKKLKALCDLGVHIDTASKAVTEIKALIHVEVLSGIDFDEHGTFSDGLERAINDLNKAFAELNEVDNDGFCG